MKIISNNNKIDLVMPTVNCNDPYWMRQYVQTFLMNPSKLKRLSGNRYRELGLLRYVMRSIEVNAPWVNNVHIIVSSESQIPDWICNVNIIYHEDIIPMKLLPTFNSCVIESFLSNIKGLSNKFIYSNDDLMFNQVTPPDMFFDINNNPKISFKYLKDWNRQNIFRSQVNNGINMICKMLNINRISDDKLLVPSHSFFPMIKDNVDKVYEYNKDELIRISSKDRTNKNVNQYIYSFYQYYTKQYSKSNIVFKYATLKSNIDDLRTIFNDTNVHSICLNDSDASEIDINPIIDLLEEKFPNKSKFEK